MLEYSMGLISAVTKASVEGFSGMNSADRRKEAYVDFISVVIALIIVIIILGFVGKWLWNGVVVDLFSCVKPARSFWQIVGLMLFVSLLTP
jgi:hypothetical protein